MHLGSRFGGAALVTGASAGLGEAFARALAKEGMDLVLVARRLARLDTLANELRRAYDVRVEFIASDLSEPGATDALRASIESKGIDVGLLVCSAGYGSYGPFLDLDAKEQSRMVDLNCRAVTEQCGAFIPPMVKRGKGGVILIGSIASYQPCPYWATYGATKAFVLMLGEALWAELAPKGVHVLALSPGYTATEFQEVANAKGAGIGHPATAGEVVAHALHALCRKPSTVHGFSNWLMVSGSRLIPRRTAASLSAWMSSPARRAARIRR